MSSFNTPSTQFLNTEEFTTFTLGGETFFLSNDERTVYYFDGKAHLFHPVWTDGESSPSRV